MSVAAFPHIGRRAAGEPWIARRRRRMVARGYQQLLADARSRPRGLSARVPIEREQVLAAAPQVERLIDRLLEAERPIDARALDAARALICDSDGPIYAWAEPRTLRRRLRVVCEAME